MTLRSRVWKIRLSWLKFKKNNVIICGRARVSVKPIVCSVTYEYMSKDYAIAFPSHYSASEEVYQLACVLEDNICNAHYLLKRSDAVATNLGLCKLVFLLNQLMVMNAIDSVIGVQWELPCKNGVN